MNKTFLRTFGHVEIQQQINRAIAVLDETMKIAAGTDHDIETINKIVHAVGVLAELSDHFAKLAEADGMPAQEVRTND